jgi:anti-sigma factor RsiW
MGLEKSEEAMGMSCQEVWRDVSDYLDDELSLAQRAGLEQHVAGCRQCSALLDGMRNVISLYRDERVLAPPEGFRERLYQKLEKETKRSRRTFLAWTLTAAAAVPLAFAALSVKKFVLPRPDAKSPASDPDAREVPDTVAVSQDHDDKVYHVAGCSHLIGTAKFLAVKEAIREGYTPCVYCIGKAQPKKNN